MSSASIEALGPGFPRAQDAGTNGWRIVGFCERIFAAFLLGLSSPLILCIALVITLISKRSPFIAHRRVAQGGRTLWLLKFRTMWDGSRRITRTGSHGLIQRLPFARSEAVAIKRANDPRVSSAFASFCRRYSLDELPQLWHVVRGEMALIGPRPLTQVELNRYYGPDSVTVLSRKPGLSGLWQIRGRSRLGYRQRRRFDLFLVRKWSPGLYIFILLATVPKVLSGKDAW